ncbi:uncharacterized protein PG998_012362 [Apiospora kogelbergensis]|uniref:Uncharacterized protein n=1 Tax=Apiospora kogelbergensis TaxID=1337665 RepID=A0AAW0QRQ6_9PEZI
MSEERASQFWVYSIRQAWGRHYANKHHGRTCIPITILALVPLPSALDGTKAMNGTPQHVMAQLYHDRHRALQPMNESPLAISIFESRIRKHWSAPYGEIAEPLQLVSQPPRVIFLFTHPPPTSRSKPGRASRQALRLGGENRPAPETPSSAERFGSQDS